MPIIPTESEVLHMKRTHGLDEKEMELVKLLMADCQTTGDIQAKLKRLFAGTIEQMLEAEMDEHLGYEKNSVEGNNSGNSRNGYGKKTIISDYGDILRLRRLAAFFVYIVFSGLFAFTQFFFQTLTTFIKP